MWVLSFFSLHILKLVGGDESKCDKKSHSTKALVISPTRIVQDRLNSRYLLRFRLTDMNYMMIVVQILSNLLDVKQVVTSMRYVIWFHHDRTSTILIISFLIIEKSHLNNSGSSKMSRHIGLLHRRT